MTKNRIQPIGNKSVAFDKITVPTPIQQRAFDLLGMTYRV